MTAALPWTRDTLPMVGARVARAWLWVLMLAALLSVVPSPALAADEPVSRFVWDEVSVAVRLQDDGTARVREHLTVRFTGGPFRQGFREIPLAYMEEISQVTVAEVGSGPPRRTPMCRPASTPALRRGLTPSSGWARICGSSGASHRP